MQAALIEGLTAGGVDVIDIGLCGTEEVYFATEHFGAGGGLMVTASHNPIDYNGIKMVQAGRAPSAPMRAWTRWRCWPHGAISRTRPAPGPCAWKMRAPRMSTGSCPSWIPGALAR